MNIYSSNMKQKNSLEMATVSRLSEGHPDFKHGRYMASALGCTAYGSVLEEAMENLVKELKKDTIRCIEASTGCQDGSELRYDLPTFKKHIVQLARDLHESGHHATAEDFQLALEFLKLLEYHALHHIDPSIKYE